MKRLSILFLMMFVLGSLVATAQSFVPCYTNEMTAKRIAEDPRIAEMHRQGTQLEVTETSSSRSGTIIPVVFHVIHANGSENISKARIEQQIERLNEDFNLQNADTSSIETLFKSRADNAQIEFRLANIDPDGNCTDGIVRIYSTLTYDANDNVKELSWWDNEKYLNIWVVAYIELDGDDPDFVVGGYAYYPNVVNWGPEVDGIVIRADQVGTGMGSSRTLTHEVGHYFNLAHTFDSGCFGGDNVSDTPPTAEPNYGCPLGLNSCHNDNPDIKDNVQNYMDYSDCGYMFTQGQVSRMHAAISTYRSELVSTSNLNATGVTGVVQPCAPKAEFVRSAIQICAGNSMSFTDESWNGEPTQWNWSFSGGAPPSSTAENPTITYNTPGVYDVTLVVSNASGSGTQTKSGFVNVLAAEAQYGQGPFAEDFEDSNQFLSDWDIENPTGGQTWAQFSGTSYSGGSCVRISNFSSAEGDIDELISPSYDMSAAPGQTMTFKYAYAQRNSDSSDKLRVLFSNDCGETWIARWVRVGSNLATTSFQTSPFTPSDPGQWEQATVGLTPAIYNAENVRVRFEFTSGGGNMLYVDDINLGGTVGIEDIMAETIGLNLYPNPTKNTSTLSFELFQDEVISLYATDVVGKRIQLTNTQQLAPGQHKIEIGKEQLGTSGVYMLTLEGENMKVVEKLVVY